MRVTGITFAQDRNSGTATLTAAEQLAGCLADSNGKPLQLTAGRRGFQVSPRALSVDSLCLMPRAPSTGAAAELGNRAADRPEEQPTCIKPTAIVTDSTTNGALSVLVYRAEGGAEAVGVEASFSLEASLTDGQGQQWTAGEPVRMGKPQRPCLLGERDALAFDGPGWGLVGTTHSVATQWRQVRHAPPWHSFLTACPDRHISGQQPRVSPVPCPPGSPVFTATATIHAVPSNVTAGELALLAHSSSNATCSSLQPAPWWCSEGPTAAAAVSLVGGSAAAVQPSPGAQLQGGAFRWPELRVRGWPGAYVVRLSARSSDATAFQVMSPFSNVPQSSRYLVLQFLTAMFKT